MNNIKILDLFCGTGGFSHGFTKFNDKFKVIGAIDINKVSTLTTRANHPDAYILNEDIRRVKPSMFKELITLENKDIDVIIGGPPCQGFSTIRPFRSVKDDDPRNSLFEQYALFVNSFRPKIFVFENVVGLIKYKEGKVLEAMQEVFYNLGYDIQWKVLNAANYGVPQKRERFIMIGVQRGAKINFPMPTNSFEGKTGSYKDKRNLVIAMGNLPPALSVMDAISDLPSLESGEEKIWYDKEPLTQYQKDRRKENQHLTLHKATSHSKKMLEIIKHAGDNISCIPKGLVDSGFSSSYSRLPENEPASTLTVNFVHPSSNKCIHPLENRALTPREGARIQSFDDDYVFCGSRTEIVRQIGNAVPPLLGEAIACEIYKSIK